MRDSGGTMTRASAPVAFKERPASSSKYNTEIQDIINEMTDSLSRSGKGGMLANLAMGAFRITGLALGTVAAVSVQANGDAGTGIYFPATNQVAIAISGTQRLLVNATGISGDGSQITALNGSNVATGTVALARLPTIPTGQISGLAAVATSGSASDLGTGTVALARLPTIPASQTSGFAAVATSGSASDLGAGTLPVNRLNGGTSASFVRGDGTYSNTLTGPLSISNAADGVSFSSTRVTGGVSDPSFKVSHVDATATTLLNFSSTAGSPRAEIQVGGVTVITIGTSRELAIAAPASGQPSLAFGEAATRIIPGATSFAVRNNANSADNLLVTDAGLATVRDDLRVLGDNLTVSVDGLATGAHLGYARGTTVSSILTVSAGSGGSQFAQIIAADTVGGTSVRIECGPGSSGGVPEMRINGTSVVGTRKTGWGAPTGTPTRTTFATGTVTLPQLAERVKALIDDLTTHGLIGV